MQYLYNDGDLYYFMDEETFEQLPLNAESIGDKLEFVKEHDMQNLLFKGQVIGLEPPTFVELEITETEPDLKVIQQQELLSLQLSKQEPDKGPLICKSGRHSSCRYTLREYMERV